MPQPSTIRSVVQGNMGEFEDIEGQELEMDSKGDESLAI